MVEILSTSIFQALEIILNEITCSSFNSLPNNEILDWSKFKEFADDKIVVAKTLKCVLGRVESIVEIGENAGNQHFLLFPQWF